MKKSIGKKQMKKIYERIRSAIEHETDLLEFESRTKANTLYTYGRIDALLWVNALLSKEFEYGEDD